MFRIRLALAVAALLAIMPGAFGSVRISEFMAENDGFLSDSDGESPDWIELHNTGIAGVNLAGWYLTDSATNLTKWAFPATNLPPNGYMIVFASGKNRAVAGGELHTSFALDNSGQYLALVRPDLSVAHAYSPAYPEQRANRSFGVGREVSTTSIIAAGANARWLVPGDGTLGNSWTGQAFGDGTWTAASTTSLAFDTNNSPTGVHVLAVDFDRRNAAPVTGSGFSSFVINSNGGATAIQTTPTTRTFGGHTVTLSNPHSVGYDDRIRPQPANSGAFTDSSLLRDFVLSRSLVATGGLDVAVTGLAPFQRYFTTIWSYDSNSPGLRVSDWYANGALVKQNYTFDGRVAPTNNTQYTFGFETAADAEGTLLIAGRFDPASVNANVQTDLGVFLNAFTLAQLGLTTNNNTGLAGAMLNQNASVYVRVPFAVTDPNAWQFVTLRMRYDDGFVAYLNGQLIASANAPAAPAWNSAATGSAGGALLREFIITNAATLLVPGQNVLAIHALNAGAADGDFMVLPELIGTVVAETPASYFAQPTPGSTNAPGFAGFVEDTRFSVDRGFFDAPFSISITSATPGAAIWYTLNGSEPSPTNGTLYTTPITISGQSFVRAAAFKAGLIPTDVDTHSYLFLRDVLRQSNNIPGYPTLWQASYPADYEVDPNIVNHPKYGPMLSNDLRSIPTLSIVTSHDAMWGTDNGIYNHPTSLGEAWDRAASVELIDGDGSTEFAVTCGISMQGNASRDNVRTPKHSFRLKFRNEWGPTKLRYDWFSSRVDEFDNIILRAAGFVDGWPSRYSDTTLYTNPTTGETYRGARYRPETSTYLRDPFVKRSHRDMGWLGSESRWVHVYVNGLYWGMYNPAERIDSSFMAEHEGGLEQDWDVLVGDDTLFNAAVADGFKTDWNAMLAIANAGITNQAAYEAIAALVDIDCLIDYMLLHIYVEVEDWPHHNWYAVHRRANPTNGMPSTKWRFITWDQEVSMDRNVRRDRVNVGASGNQVDSPARIYSQLRAWPEFNVRFGDRVQKHLFNGGALTWSNNVARFARLAEAITNAINGESLRWGDAREFPTPSNPVGTGQTFTRDEWWVPELHKLWTNFFATLNDTNIARLRAGGLYPSISAPSFSQFGGSVSNGFNLAITHANGSGVIYFTTDGQDPRGVGGSVYDFAEAYAAPVPINRPTMIKSRVLLGGVWSALVEAAFFPPQDLSQLALTELMYHAPDVGATDGDIFDFLELKNTGTNSLDLSGLRFTEGISFVFSNIVVAPGGFVLLVRDPAAFAAKYPGVPFHGTYNGRLDNGGEAATLAHPLGTPIWSLTYDDIAPWPVTADGFGYSLVPLASGSQAPDQGAKWRASTFVGGSPGADDPAPTVAPVVINEILTHTDLPAFDRIELFNPNAAPVDVGGWFLTDDPAFPKKYRITGGTTIAPFGFLVLDEPQFNPTPGTNTSFSLSSRGEQVYLFSGNTQTNLTGYSHGVAFGAAANGVSFGRHINSVGEEQFPAQIALTFPGTNSGPRIGPVVINEIHYNPATGGDPFIELRNITGSPVPLYDVAFPTNRWRVEGIDFSFPTNTTLAANGYVVICATNPAAFRAKHSVPANVPVLGPYSGTLQLSGERVTLRRPDAPDTNGAPYIDVDTVRYNDNAPWPAAADGTGPSLQRKEMVYGDDPMNWRTGVPTPGAANSADTDSDGMPDDWENANGTNPLIADGNADLDGDGMTNLQEFMAGTDPRVGGSVLKLTASYESGPTLTFTAAATRSYGVQFKNALGQITWQTLTNVQAAAVNRTVVISDSASTNVTRFYRLVTPAQ